MKFEYLIKGRRCYQTRLTKSELVLREVKMTIVVKAGPNDTSDQVIKKFKKKVQQEQILTKIKEREFYKKPSVVKKERLAELKRKKRRKIYD